MTHIHKYRLPMKYRHPNALRNLARAIAIGFAIYGFWWSITSYQVVAEAEGRIIKAEREREQLLAVLNGKAQMVEHRGKYVVIERVIWEVEK